MYMIGGFHKDGSPNKHVYFTRTSSDSFSFEFLCDAGPLPAGAIEHAIYLPQYKHMLKQLGLVCILKGHSLYTLDIKGKTVAKFDELPSRLGEKVQIGFLDDVSGPAYVLLDQKAPETATALANAIGGCSRARSLWVTDGASMMYRTLNESAEFQDSAWQPGPNVPIPVSNFGLGRVFIRGQNRAYGTTSCAMLYLAGGTDSGGKIRNEIQALVAQGKTPNEQWSVLTLENNGTDAVFGVKFPPSLLSLPAGLSQCACLTELWPEMLVTGARTTIMGRDTKGSWRCFFAGWRFLESSMGTDGKWDEIPCPSNLVKGADYNLAAVCAIDQKIPGAAPSITRTSRFLLDFAQSSPEVRFQTILSIPAVTSFPSLEVLKLPAAMHKEASAAFLFADNIGGEADFTAQYSLGSSESFPKPRDLGGVNCPGFLRMFMHESRMSQAFSLLYSNSWLGKFVLPSWGDEEESSFVVNKFTTLGHRFLHPDCPKGPGIELTGKITRGTSVWDGKPCFTLTYGCESGRKMLPTIPPVPTSAIMDELRWVKTPGDSWVLWGLTFLTLFDEHHLVLGFVLFPTSPLW